MSNLRSSLIRRERTPVRSPRPLTAGKRRENNFVPTEIISTITFLCGISAEKLYGCKGAFDIEKYWAMLPTEFQFPKSQ